MSIPTIPTELGQPVLVTLAAIRAHKPCVDGYRNLATFLRDRDHPEDQPFPMSWILDSNGYADTKWALRVLGADSMIVRLWAADCAEHVLHLFEREYPGDPRPRRAIEAARRYACGRLGVAARAAGAAARAAGDAAWAAAGDAAWAAARDAAWAAGDAAWAAGDAGDAARAAGAAARDAGAAAWAAARDAGDAAWAAARDAGDAARADAELWQQQRLRAYLDGLLPAPVLTILNQREAA